jgi:phosphohistidine phosphatase
MELILWRHADAEAGEDDEARKLTPKGVKQAAHMARWLAKRLPDDALVLVSPAVRARETAQPLERKVRVDKKVGTGASAAQLLEAAGWPNAKRTVMVVGHQPAMGAAAALALTGAASEWRMKKGAIWWIEVKDGEGAAAVRAALAPDMI